MKKRKTELAVLLAVVLLLTAGCGKRKSKPGGLEAVQLLRENISFSTALAQEGEDASIYLSGLPEGSKAVLYRGSGYFADEIILITMKKESDRPAVERSLNKHISELKEQFLNYFPEEVGKIDHAVIYHTDHQTVLCITNDYAAASEILNGGNFKFTPHVPEETSAPALLPTVPETTAPVKSEYPVLQSKSGQFHDYGNNIIRVDNTAFELYGYLNNAAKHYAHIVNTVSDALEGETQVYALAIPTAVGVVLPDDIAKILPSFVNQGAVIEKIYHQMNDSVVPVRCFQNLMAHRDEYLYFRTDHHWNGRGAYYAYESFCNTKGIQPIPLSERARKEYEGFLGSLYFQGSGEDPVLKEKPDTVEAFCPKSQSASMKFTDDHGMTYDWNIIMDVSDWDTGTKYNTFAGSDNPIAEFTNPRIENDSVCVVIKESYGNALLPYLVDHYHTIYEIDYRYWDGNLIDFAREKNADDLLFANNLTMISTDLLVGKLAGIVHS